MESKNYLAQLFSEVERGKQGLNEGLPMGFDRLSTYIAKIQQARYDLIGGSTGSGKTALVDSAYLSNPYDYLKSNDSIYKLEIIYYSLEIDPVQKISKLMANKLWRDYQIKTDVSTIFSKGKNRISDEVYQLVHSVKDYFEEMNNSVFYRNSCNPNYLFSDLMRYSETRGKVIKDENGYIINYIPNNPNLITLVIIDHIGLITPNAEDINLKAAMDRLSKHLIFFRNNMKFSPVVVSQFNRSIENFDRMKSSNEPQLSDFKDSSGPSEDANTVIGLYYPYRYGKSEHLGYNIEKLTNYYRSVHLLKNRDGQDELSIGLFFMGQNGYFEELPRPSQFLTNPYLYNELLTRNQIEVVQNTNSINLNNL